MSTGFSVDLAALEQAAEGVNGTLDQLTQQSVSDIPYDPSAIGHERLAGTVTDFCDRWQRGVSNLATDGREIAKRLTANVNAYRKADQDVRDKVNSSIFQGAGPDPGTR
jgi:hypothetical protein